MNQLAVDKSETVFTTIQHNDNLVVALEQATIRTIRDADAALLLVKLELDKQNSVDLKKLSQQGLLDVQLFDGLAIIDTTGRIQGAFPARLKDPTVNLSDRDYFKVHRNFSDTLFISKPLQSRTIGKQVIVISRKIVDKNKNFKGVIAIQIRPAAFMSFYRDASIEPFDILSLISPEGITYSRRTGSKESCGEDIIKSPLFTHLKKNPVGNYLARDAIRDLPTYFSYRKLEKYPVIATVGRNEQDVLAAFYIRRRQDLTFASIISFILLVFFASIWFVFREKRKLHAAVRISEARYRSIFESSRDAILVLQPTGTIEAMNRSARAMFKYIGPRDGSVLFQEIFAQSVPFHTFDFSGEMKEGEQKEYEFTRLGGGRFFGELAHSHYYDDNNQEHTIVLIRDVTHRRRLEKKHQNEQKRFQQHLTRQIIIAQEREREAVGHELHDNVNQVLTTIKLYLETSLRSPQSKDTFIQRSIGLLQHSIGEIRNLSHSLSAPTLGTGSLVDAINALIENITECSGLCISFEVQEYSLPIDREQSLAIYRIAQEQLANIIKHASASSVEIKLWQKDRQTYFSISDDGNGFDVNKKSDGIGLTNIASRMKAFQGNYSISSAVGSGCTLKVSLPITKSSSIELT